MHLTQNIKDISYLGLKMCRIIGLHKCILFPFPPITVKQIPELRHVHFLSHGIPSEKWETH